MRKIVDGVIFATILLLLSAVGGHHLVCGANTAPEDVDLLDLVIEGAHSSVATVSSGKGQVTVERRGLKSDGGYLTIKTDYNVAFVGDKFSYTAKDTYLENTGESQCNAKLIPPGTEKVRKVAFDGQKVISYEPSNQNATIGDASSPLGRSVLASFKVDLAIPGQGHAIQEISPGAWPGSVVDKTQVVGKETLDGDECVVVQMNATTQGIDGPFQVVRKAWVAPERGFVVRRIQEWVKDEGDRQSILILEVNTRVREYANGIWGPASVTLDQFKRRDVGTSDTINTVHTEITYAKDFRLNVPVTGDELTITLPSGTAVTDELLNASYVVP